MRLTAFALVFVAALVAFSGAHRVAAQGVPALRNAGSGPRDLKSTLFSAANAMGMLRGLQQEDSITTFEFWASGTLTDGNETFKVSSYRGSVRFRTVPGMRVDYTGSSKGKPPQRRVQVVAGTLAWNETEPGLNPMPALETAPERFLQYAALPQSVVKLATVAGDKASVNFEGDRATVKFPIQEVDKATVSATLDAKSLIEKVVIAHGDVVTETTYSGYADLNERNYKADILFPRRIIRKRGGTTVLDLTVSKTNTYNPYVIMPVPENVEKSRGGSR
jgi:hypothetical protein